MSESNRDTELVHMDPDKIVTNIVAGTPREVLDKTVGKRAGLLLMNARGEQIAVVVFDDAAQFDGFINMVLNLRNNSFLGKH